MGVKKKSNQKTNKTNSLRVTIILCGIIACVIAFILYYTLFNYQVDQTIPYEGYAISGKTLSNNLLNPDYQSNNETIKPIKVSEEGNLYRKLNKFFIGEEKKEEINLNYPIYVKNDISLYNLSQNVILITEEYGRVEGFPRFTLAGGNLYNANNLERIDTNQYAFIRNEDNVYINLSEIRIKTLYHEYEIPINCIINFAEDYIAYYQMQGEVWVYHKIADVDLDSQVKILKIDGSYKEFLIGLTILPKEEKEEEIPVEDGPTIPVEKEEEKKEETVTTKPEENKPEVPDEKVEEGEEPKEIYIKPEVQIDEFKASVYSMATSVRIKDPAKKIVSSITFVVENKGKVYMRKSVSASGTWKIVGLMPNETYSITGTYIYKNEEGKKIQRDIYFEDVHTGSVDSLDPISLTFENGDIFPRKVQIKNLKIASDKDAEALNGIKKMELMIGKSSYTVPTASINKLLRGSEITYDTQEVLKSNSSIEYQFKIYDLAGNELKVENAIGRTRTAKSEPSVSVKVEKQDISEVKLALSMENTDKVVLGNYQYFVLDTKGQVVAKGNLQEKDKQIVLTTLDPNQYYTINLYADYNLEDGNGVKENQIIGSATFSSLPLSVLGYLNIKGQVTELEKDKITIQTEINSDKTDFRLTNILQSFQMTISKGNEEVQSIGLNTEQIQALKTGEILPITFENLEFNTEYTIKMTATIKQGSVEEAVKVVHSLGTIQTKKDAAHVYVKNQFVTESMIDFDVKVEDINGAILDNVVRMEVRDTQNKLIKMETIPTNRDYIRLTYEKLDEKTNYIINFYANEYNEGNDATTYQSNYLLDKIQIYTQPGISGKIEVTDILREGNGKNLVDAASEVKWYSSCFNTGNYWDKTYDRDAKSMRLYAGRSNSAQYYTYDLRQYAGKTVTVSFKAKLDENSNGMKVYLQNSKTGSNRTQINGITVDAWKEFTYTVTLDTSGYLGFYVQAANTVNDYYVYLKELQIELGSRATAYQDYKYNVEGNININLQDSRDEITDNDYYIGIYKNGKEVALENYKEIDENNQVIDAIKHYTLEEGVSYEFRLLAKVRDRFYTLSTTNFNTGGEILGIRNKDEFLQMQPNGNYLILNDIDLSGATGSTARFGNDRFGFMGTVDFQGRKLIRDASTGSPVFYWIERSAIVENLILELHLNNKTEFNWYRGLTEVNRGIIRNIVVNLVESTEKANTDWGLIGYANYGTLENFVINLQTPWYVGRAAAAGFRVSYGDIRNGYLYGEPIQATFEIAPGQWRDIAPLVQNLSGGKIENVYSLINVNVKKTAEVTENVANVVDINNYGIMRNVYSVGEGNAIDLAHGPSTYRNSSGRNENVYYFSDTIYNNTFNQKTTLLALYDADYQRNMLGDQFDIDELVKQKYYPQVKMSNKMPNQEYIDLPEVQDKDLVDIVSFRILEEKNGNYLKVQLNVNNPSGENITNVEVTNLTTKILSQEYADGKSSVIVELTNPIKCVSKYSIRSITSRGAFNKPYTRYYEENERMIAVDFYNQVNTIADWKNINKSPTENYRLMQDLDFKNEGGDIRITQTYSGKIDGDGHTIQNIFIPDIGNGLFTNLSGTIKNLKIKNYRQNTTTATSLGIIATCSGTATIDDVHVDGIELGSKINNANMYVGGFAANATNLIIQNSSIKNFKFKIDGVADALRAGGMVGNGSTVKITNSFIQGLDFDIQHVMQYDGIGGIIGREGSSQGRVEYCYVTGNMTTDAEMVGGIYGFTSSLNVRYNYSLLNMDSKTDYLGGIGGYDNNGTTTSTTGNLSLGRIYSTKTSNYIGRIIGNQSTELGNYAYASQLINGFVSSERMGAQLLTGTELITPSTYQKIGFGDNYNYDELSDGILPKLYNTTKTELLPGQDDNKLELGDFEISAVDMQKKDMTTIEGVVIIENPAQVTIKDITIDNMEVTIISNANYPSEGKTYLTLRAKMLKAYDSYQITKISYMAGAEEVEVPEEVKINIQFFNEIHNFEDWQNIDTDSAQNYKLMADIDFTGKINPKANVSIGRLEAEGSGYTLKNLTIDNLNARASGLIKEVKNSIKNITFENIHITNNASGNYSGLIVRNIGVLDNVKFKDISVKAPKMSYVGMIANNSAVQIKNINLENIEVSGINYVGGFIGRTDSGTYNVIKGKNINVTATGSNIGGLIGYVTGRSPYTLSDFSVDGGTVKGTDYIGGILGRGRLGNGNTNNVTVQGRNYIGGIAGVLEYHENMNTGYKVTNSNIKSTGSYVGGAAGQAYRIYNALVQDCKVTSSSTGSNYVGGITGALSTATYYEVRGSAAINTIVESKGNNIGGITGYLAGNIYYTFAKGCTVTGYSNVGGLAGNMRSGQIKYNYNDSNVTATAYNAGGVVGYLNNQYMTGANYTSRIIQNYVANAQITAPTKVGGLIGAIVEELYGPAYYASNLVEATVMGNTTAVSMGIGSAPLQNSKMQYFFVYDNSRIKGEKVSIYNDRLSQAQLLTLAELKTQSTYTSKIRFDSSFNYTSLSQNKYPLVKNNNYTQEGIPLPTANAVNTLMTTASSMLLARNTMTIPKMTLPEMMVYPVSATEFNIEFNKTEENSFFTYQGNGEKSELIPITKKVFTFEYDYQTPITIEITDGVNTATKEIKPEEIARKITVQGENYYYLENGKMKSSNDSTIPGEFVNVYQNRALTKDGKVYDFNTKETKPVAIEQISLKEEKPIEEEEYKGTTIKAFAKFSYVVQEGKTVERQGQLLVRNGILSILSASVDKKVDDPIIDNYNGKEYQTVLGTDGKLYDLKTGLKYPDGFKNANIDEIEVSTNREHPTVMLYYSSGRVYAFNYITGKVVYDNEVKENISIGDYIKQQLSELSPETLIETDKKEYEESKKLAEQLRQNATNTGLSEMNNTTVENVGNTTGTVHNQITDTNILSEGGSGQIHTSVNNNGSSGGNSSGTTNGQTGGKTQEASNYITVYDNASKKYIVYNEDKILDVAKTEIISENQVIEKQGQAAQQNEKNNKFVAVAVNGLILVLLTIGAIVIILYILRRKNSNK